MKHLALSRQDVIELTGWSKRTVQLKAHQGLLLRCEVTGGRRLRNGRKVVKFTAASPALIPYQLQIAERHLATAHQESALALADSDQPTLFEASAPPAQAALTDTQKSQALTRQKMLQPLIEFRHELSKGRRPEIAIEGGAVRTMDQMAAWIGAQHELSRSKVWAWLKRYDEEGLAGLADKPRSDKGRSRFFAEFPEAALFVQQKYLNENLSITVVHEALLREWPRLYNHGSQPPCYRTVREFLKALPKPIAILAREGKRAFAEKCEEYLPRDYESYRINETWVSDHGKHDVWAMNDGFFPFLPLGRAVRVWLTPIEDMRSRKILGYAFSYNPSSLSFGSALRMAMMRYGVPEEIYIDNGKDFQKLGAALEDWKLTAEVEGVLHRFGCKVTSCIPFHPQSKPVESWFKTVRNRWDSMWREWYCGNRPSARPEICSEALKEHEALMKAGEWRRSKMPTVSEFIALTIDWIENDYNARHAHSGRGMNGRTPDQVFDELLPQSERRPVEERALDILLWDRKERVVSEGGCVERHGQRYEPADQESYQALFLQIGRKALVACDPANIGEAVVLDQERRFLGKVRAQELAAHGPISIDALKQSMKLRAKSRAATRTYLDLVAHASAALGNLPEMERRRRNIGLHRAPLAATLQLEAGTPSPAEPEPESRYTDELVDKYAGLMEK